MFSVIAPHAATLRRTSRHHAVEQRLEIIHMLVDHAVTMQLFKQLLRTRYFCLLNRTKLERGERSLRLRDEVDVPHLPLAKHNRTFPVPRETVAIHQ